MKFVASAVVVPVIRVHRNTKKICLLYQSWVKQNNKNWLWYHIWDQCDQPRNGLLFQIVESTKKRHIKLVATWKKQQVKDIPTKIRNNPKLLYNEVNRLG